ncbi:MAG: hypothetical protein LBG24_01010 [Treponema sp.]|nr:hypothetical protein [Treponema sp.]
MVKLTPCPFSDEAEIGQPWQPTTHLATASPSPMPCSRREELPRQGAMRGE